MLSVVLLTYARFRQLVLPVNPVLTFVDLVLLSVLMYAITKITALSVVVTGKVRSAHFASFMPLILAFVA